MPAFKVEVSHGLGQDDAVTRLKSFIEKVAAQYKEHVSEMSGEWLDNQMKFSLKTFGFVVSGNLHVTSDKARVDGQIPFAALIFRGKLESDISAELKRALA